MKNSEKFFVGACIVICLVVLIGYTHDSADCKARGGNLMRTPFSSYECYKAERVK